MEPPEGAPVNLNPRGRADFLKDHLLRGLEEAKSAGLPLPLYITIIDAPSDFRVVLRANSYNSNLKLISGPADQPFEYPLDVFISRRLYPVELEANEQFVVMNIELSKAQNVIGDWMHSTAYPMLLVPALRDEMLQNYGILGWRRTDTDIENGPNPLPQINGAVKRYAADIRHAVSIGADIVVNSGPGGAAYAYEAGPREDKKTLKIGPLHESEVKDIMEFIRSLTPSTYRVKLEPQEFQTYFNHRRTGRNDPCPCKSGKKYRKCCGSLQ